MANLALDDLLATGVSLEQLLMEREPTEVNIKIDTSDLADEAERAHTTNTKLFSAMGQSLEHSNNSNRLLLSKLVELVNRTNVSEPSSTKERVVGIRVLRNELNLIDYLEFVKED